MIRATISIINRDPSSAKNTQFGPVTSEKGLVKCRYQEISSSDWVLANRQLLDLANWDLRMIYSDNY